MQFVKPKKSLGQHFLKDNNIANKIVESLDQNSKNVLELRYMQIVRLLLLEDRLQVNQASHNKLTPLFVCSQNNLVDVVELLLERKDIEINKAIEDGRTPLYIASQKNNTKNLDNQYHHMLFVKANPLQ